MVRRLVRGGRGVLHAMAGRGLVLCVLLRPGNDVFFGDQPRTMRSRRFHPPGEDEGYGERKAKAGQPLDHAARMASKACLSI